jgi:hypothetical protein
MSNLPQSTEELNWETDIILSAMALADTGVQPIELTASCEPVPGFQYRLNTFMRQAIREVYGLLPPEIVTCTQKFGDPKITINEDAAKYGVIEYVALPPDPAVFSVGLTLYSGAMGLKRFAVERSELAFITARAKWFAEVHEKRQKKKPKKASKKKSEPKIEITDEDLFG